MELKHNLAWLGLKGNFILMSVRAKLQRLTLCIPFNCSPPGSSLHGILQARILEWVTMPSSRGSSQPRNLTCVSCLLHCQAGSLPLAQAAYWCQALSLTWSLIWCQGMVLVILRSSRAGLIIFFNLSSIKESLKENLIPLLPFQWQVDLYYIPTLRQTGKYLQHTHLPPVSFWKFQFTINISTLLHCFCLLICFFPHGVSLLYYCK